MNRKLAHSLTALSTSALVLAALAFAGAPLPPGAGTAPAVDAVASAPPVSDPAPREAKLARRNSLAMPYFSFARGDRRIGG